MKRKEKGTKMRMASAPEGTRVLAIQKSDQETVYAYGMGTYVGDEVCPLMLGEQNPARLEAVIRAADKQWQDGKAEAESILRSWLWRKVERGDITQAEMEESLAKAQAHKEAEMAKPMSQRVSELELSLAENPKIVLDSGGHVWGCECWWGEASEDQLEKEARGRKIIMIPAPHDES